MFSIYNKVTRGSFIMKVSFPSFSFFFSYSYYLSLAILAVYLLTNYLSLTIIIVLLLQLLLSMLLLLLSIIIIVMLININIPVILEKSSGGEFQARNSSSMVYPYISCYVMNKSFQRHIQSPQSISGELFLILLKGFRSLCNVTRSSVLVVVGVLYMPLHFVCYCYYYFYC